MKKGIFTILFLSITVFVFSQNNNNGNREETRGRQGGIYKYVDTKDAETLLSAKEYTDQAKAEAIAEATRLANVAQANAISRAIVLANSAKNTAIEKAKQLSNKARQEAIAEAKRLANEAIAEAVILANQARDEAIARAIILVNAARSYTDSCISKIELSSSVNVASGNVGIGTTDPDAKFEVKTDDGHLARFSYTGDNSNPQLDILGSPNKINLRTTDYSKGGEGNDLSFSTSTVNDALIIKESGNVGIGTSTPNHLLHLYGTGVAGGGSKIAFGDCNTFEQANATGGLNCLVGEFSEADTDILQLHGKKGISITTGNYQNGAYQEAMHIDSYHSDGATVVRVNGLLLAREVEVAVNVWADYVFENNYKLLTIKELNSFITKNKHLPDVPNAKEVEKEGVNLGEMDAILLQKVEELTLYIIQLENRISELEKK